MAETTDKREEEKTDASDHSPTVSIQKQNEAEKSTPKDDEEEHKHEYQGRASDLPSVKMTTVSSS
ncbi:hypothetical protein V1517DRAFT_8295 [Lipomyces orientalis]|uniref:Uncharacterized protein n=1 Tax=Lipomyces orientalis TaxID=1233043 RepID=A0ACC3TGF2_9ASCO